MKGFVDVIIGMQFGSEGKGKVAGLLAHKYDAAVRVGAPNAGHTVIYNEQAYKMRHVPCAWINKNAKLYIGAGGLINLEVLCEEIRDVEYRSGVDITGRLRIDINAGIVTKEDIETERAAKMYENIGSTTEGIGEAMARKLKRRGAVIASDVKELQPMLTNVGTELNDIIDKGGKICVEGTQGYGLSLNHGYYPYCTSRDVLASSILGECGLSPLSVNRIIGVLRTYPIRVQGNSGPMGAEELSWADVAKESGYNELEERTTVTKRIRRVSRINWDLLRAAVHANRPTELAVCFADYIDHNDRNCCAWNALSEKTRQFIDMIEKNLSTRVNIISTGPGSGDTIYKPLKFK